MNFVFFDFLHAITNFSIDLIFNGSNNHNFSYTLKSSVAFFDDKKYPRVISDILIIF